MNKNDWIVFGIFAGLWTITIIVTLVVSIWRRKNNFAFWTLIIGGLMRCIAIFPMNIYGTVVSDFAGLLFFSSCCIVLTQIVHNFYEKRNNKNGIYYSMMFVLIGYNVLFYILECCVATLTIYFSYAKQSASSAITEHSDDGLSFFVITNLVMCVLFGLSFSVLAITYLIIFFMLKNSWIYLKKIVVFCK